jgi:hypothetical protein
VGDNARANEAVATVAPSFARFAAGLPFALSAYQRAALAALASSSAPDAPGVLDTSDASKAPGTAGAAGHPGGSVIVVAPTGSVM